MIQLYWHSDEAGDTCTIHHFQGNDSIYIGREAANKALSLNHELGHIILKHYTTKVEARCTKTGRLHFHETELECELEAWAYAFTVTHFRTLHELCQALEYACECYMTYLPREEYAGAFTHLIKPLAYRSYERNHDHAQI